jgi:hypothetical protein
MLCDEMCNRKILCFGWEMEGKDWLEGGCGRFFSIFREFEGIAILSKPTSQLPERETSG